MGHLAGSSLLTIGVFQIVRYAVLLLILCGITAIAHIRPAAAADESWSIVETKGGVEVLRAGFQPIALTDGVVLHPGDRIVTTGTGRAVLTRGRDTIIVAPNSEIGLPALKRPGWGTRIIQEIGTIFLKVETAAERRFEVETPVLAAVVKGTRFTVTANPLGAAVHVLEGAVEVSSFESQQTGLVMPGQTARLDSSPGSRLQIDGNVAPRDNKAKSFERTIKTDEPEGDKVTVPGAPEVKEASLGGGDGGRGVGRAIGRQLAVDRVSAVELKSESTEGRKVGQRLKAQVTPKAIKVALGDTSVDLRKVTRGLVRNVVVQPKSEKKASQAEKKAARKAEKAAAKAGKVAKVEVAVDATGDLVENEQGGPAEGSEGAATGAVVANVPPGLADSGDVAPGLDDKGGMPPGLADKGGVPPGQAKQAGLPSGLGDAGAAPAGLGDTGGATAGLGDTGGAPAGLGDTGGVPAGLADTGGVPPGLADTGGVPPGLADTNGVPAGLADTGGVPAGLADTGGVPAGLADTGGVPAGLADTGGVPAGLADTGGVPAGLADTGGIPAGLADTGGVPPGLADTGGIPTGLGDTGGVPPGLVDKGGVPPGQAKKDGNGNGNGKGNGKKS